MVGNISEILVLAAAIFAGLAGIVLFAGARRVRVTERSNLTAQSRSNTPS